VPKPDAVDVDIAVAAIKAAREDTMKRLFAAAMVEQNPARREKILERLAEMTRHERTSEV
jgi:hypothetical protein